MGVGGAFGWNMDRKDICVLTLRQGLLAAAIAYDYSDDDKAAMRKLAIEDRAGLEQAILSDPWLPWVAYEHGITEQPPTQGD